MKKTVFALVLFIMLNVSVAAEGINVQSNAAILVERTTGEVLYEKNADEKLPMASVTKTMTLLLAVEAVDSGKISLDDVVIVSDKASSMTGSRVYLSTNEKISVSDLLKSIAVSSGNDAAVAIAEYIGGTEENFVEMMNKKAEDLGLVNTRFVNSYGLDSEGHYSTARELSVISSELLSHETIRPYLTIWMDSIRNGTFTLSNTNKLVRFYDGCTGVKTGFTSQAMYCVSASAKRDGMELIAVILGGHNSKQRFADASSLLNYGFAGYRLLNCTQSGEVFGEVKVEKGDDEYIKAISDSSFSFLDEKTSDSSPVKKVYMKDSVTAPIKQNDILGEVSFYLDDEKIGSVNLVAECDVKKSGLLDIFNKLILRCIKL